MKTTSESNSDPLDELVKASKAGKTWMDASALMARTPTPQEQSLCLEWIHKHPDRDAYHVLGWLYKSLPEAYQTLPDTVRAAVLCDAMAHQKYLNDFAVLDLKESSNRAAGKALLANGKAAVAGLRNLLDNADAAPLMGSEEATLSSLYQYRRKDFAYYFLCQILGQEFIFDADPAARDARMEGFH